MIDIDLSLQASDSNPTFWVEFEVEGEAEKPALEIRVEQRPQRKILNKFIRATAAVQDGQASNIAVDIDYYEMSLALADYVVNWKGFAGAFDKGKLKKWLERFGQYAEAFAQNFKGLLEQYENALLKRREAEVKN